MKNYFVNTLDFIANKFGGLVCLYKHTHTHTHTLSSTSYKHIIQRSQCFDVADGSLCVNQFRIQGFIYD